MTLDTERVVLSQMLQDPHIIDDHGIVGELFTTRDNLDIFTAISRARDDYPRVDLISVSSALESIGRTDLVQTVAGLEFASSANARFYVRRLRETRRRKQLAHSLASGLEALKDENAESSEVADSIMGQITTAIQQTQEPEVPTMHTVMPMYFDALNTKVKARRNGETTLAAFGIREIDELLHEVRPGEVIVIAGRPGAGKTALALQLMHNTALNLGKAGAFFSMEMRRDEVIDRIIAQTKASTVSSLRGGYLSDPAIKDIQDKSAALYEAPLSIYDGAQTLGHIRSRIRRESATRGLKVACIDYLGLIDLGTGGKVPRWERIGEVSRALKLLALDLGIVIVEVVQMNREADGQEPTLGVLRDSGAIEQDADRVIMLHATEKPDDKQTERQVAAIMAKNRHGPCGKTLLTFDGQHVVFRGA